MARKTHVIGYRLGVGVWWKERVAPKQERRKGIEKLVRGVMERYGYITSEVLVQKGEGKGGISLVGQRGERGENGWKEKREVKKGEMERRVEMYLEEYLRELLKKREGESYEVSYREEEKIERNGELVSQEIAKSQGTIRETMKKRQRNESRSNRK